MTYSDDITAIKALKNGESNALEWIYDKYVQPLLSYAATMTGCKATAEDIVQDVFAKLWEECEVIKITESLRAYLHACVRNKWRNCLDHIEVKRKHARSVISESDMLTEHDNNLENILISEEIKSAIMNTIEYLPKKQKAAVELWMDGFSDTEIAEQLNISTNTVRTHLKRAFSTLKISLSFLRK